VLVLAPFFLEEKIFKICILYKKKFNKSVISAIAWRPGLVAGRGSKNSEENKLAV
jgi:hypothetical protein